MSLSKDKVYQIIDGRDAVKGHGGTDMPRIRAIVDYLKSPESDRAGPAAPHA